MSKLSIVRLGALVCAAAFFAGCETSSSTDGQMGVVGGDSAACAKACSSEAKTCTAGEAKTCSGEKAECTAGAAKPN